MDKSLWEAYIASVILIVIMLTVTNGVLLLRVPILGLIALSVLGVLWLVFYFKQPYQVSRLATTSWLNLAAVIVLGITIGHFLNLSLLLGGGIGLSVADILSFTKRGQGTLNARIMSNKELMAKLIVYGITTDKRPVPTKGLGDFLFYALLVSGGYHLLPSPVLLVAMSVAIFIGCFINWGIVGFLYKREGYKGFPATFIPFLLAGSILLIRLG